MAKYVEERIRQIEAKLGKPVIEILMEEEELRKRFPWGMEHPSPFMVLPIEDLEFLYENADVFEEKKIEFLDSKAS